MLRRVARQMVVTQDLPAVFSSIASALVEQAGQGTIRWSGADEFADLPLIRPSDSHKGLYGHVLVVAGSAGKSGAAVLAGV